MATNTTVLIIVAAVAALLLAGMLAGVVYKTRPRQRHVKGETVRDLAEENVRHVRHQEALADEYAVKAHAAQVEVDIKSARACRLQREAAAHRSEAAASHAQLNEQSSRAENSMRPRIHPNRPGSQDDFCHWAIGSYRCPNFDFSPSI